MCPSVYAADNGIALNPSRRGCTGRLVEHVRSLGVEPITSKPYHPNTQGKNERFGQTLFRYLHQQPLAASIAELQEQVDRFDLVYNTQRPHQGLPGRHHPAAGLGRHRGGPGTRPDRNNTAPITPGGSDPQPDTTARRRAHRHKPIGATGQRELTISRNGTVHIGGIAFLIQYTWPPQGTAYVSHHPPDPTNQRGGRGHKKPQPSPMS